MPRSAPEMIFFLALPGGFLVHPHPQLFLQISQTASDVDQRLEPVVVVFAVVIEVRTQTQQR